MITRAEAPSLIGGWTLRLPGEGECDGRQTVNEFSLRREVESMITEFPETVELPPVDVPPRVVSGTIKQRQINNANRRRATSLTSSINVALAIDGNYVAHAAATMSSMVEMIDRATSIRFFLLTNSTLSPQDRTTLCAIFPDCNIDFIDVDASGFTW